MALILDSHNKFVEMKHTGSNSVFSLNSVCLVPGQDPGVLELERAQRGSSREQAVADSCGFRPRAPSRERSHHDQQEPRGDLQDFQREWSDLDFLPDHCQHCL